MALSTKTTLLISLILIVYIFPVIGSTSDADHACSPHKVTRMCIVVIHKNIFAN
ncbi:hypothetical protein HanPI659440_Chr15g0606021 [Helianthus annuus]|nr:hypothetical protein HanHA89_Chr15g0626051 [Helianthus annuus]KAJ0694191.1 hypothetical protein HanPI659440_Chr15g0606021 [Helianthus annuus]